MLKKNRKLISLLLVVAVLAGLLVTTMSAGANAGTGDINGDGKITAYDVQLLAEAARGKRTLTSEQLVPAAQIKWQDLLARVRNAVSEAPQAVDGVYALDSVADLFYMAKHPDLDYILTADIDMGGANWTPVTLKGSLDGDGHTISNVYINKGVKNSVANTIDDQGFFGEIKAGASVTDLTLQNIDIVASADAQLIGLLAGTNRGTVTGCYAEGSITDLRESVTLNNSAGAKTLVAALIARCVGDGTYSTVSNVQATEPGIADNGTYVAAKLAVNVADRDDIKVCLSASNPTDSTVTQWQDISASYFATEGEKALQDIVVDYMYDMGTIEWTPSEQLSYTPNGGDEKFWKTTYTYVGLPYNQMHGSLERFEYALDNYNAVKAATPGTWETSNYDNSNTDDSGYNGWVRYMGNDCSGAIYHAWMKVSASDKGDTHQGVQVNVTNYMLPTPENVANYGIQKVGNYTIPDGFVQNTDDAEDIWNANTALDMYSAFAQARKGDALVSWMNGTNSKGVDYAEGHSRLIAEDPVAIRNTDGSFDVEKSYFIVHEQGGRLTEYATADVVPRCSWGINYKYPFDQLDADVPVHNNDNDSSRCYMPITIRALHKDALRATWAEATTTQNMPNKFLYSNYYIVSATVTVTDAGGSLVATKTAYNNVGTGERQQVSGGARTGDHNSYGRMMVLEEYFGGMMEGQAAGTYNLQVTGVLSNGCTVDFVAGTLNGANGTFGNKLPATFTYAG